MNKVHLQLATLDNKINNTTCPSQLESLLYERKGLCTNWKAKAEEARQEYLRLEAEKEARLGLLEKLKRFLQYD